MQVSNRLVLNAAKTTCEKAAMRRSMRWELPTFNLGELSAQRVVALPLAATAVAKDSEKYSNEAA